MVRLGFAGLLLALLVAAPRPLHAQLGGLSVGAAFGATHPRGEAANGFDDGRHYELLGDLALPLVPIGFRGELAYDQMSRRTGTGPLKVASGTINATFSLPFPLVHPYAIAGGGYYIHNSSIGSGREGRVGFNGGLGAELHLGSVRTFAEARYHTVSYTDVQLKMIPITVGVIF